MGPRVCFILVLVLVSVFWGGAFVGWGSSAQAGQLGV